MKNATSAAPRATGCSTFRAGDVVKHHPTGETWILGTDECYGEVFPLGWPETSAKAKDCELVEAASEESRLSQLQQCAELPSSDIRGRTAKEQLRMINT